MIIITGASRGIGKFLLEKFTALGNEDVVGFYHSTMPDEKLEKYYKKLDLTDYAAVKEWIGANQEALKDPVLINCAGNNFNAFAHKMGVENWENVINVNLTATFNLIHEVLPFMRAQGYGRIINFASIVAQTGIPGTSSYAAAKSGLWGMSRAIAIENAKKGITVNNLNLGYFNIGMISDVPEAYLQTVIEKIPVGRLGDPENIYNAVNFLINSDYITGSSVDINGGLF